MKLLQIPLVAIVIFMTTATLFSQEIALSSFLIPAELKENANAVIRLNETVATIEDSDEMSIKTKRIVTVLNKAGNRNLDATFYYSDNQKIISLQAIVYNASGKKLKKFSKSKFQDVTATSGSTLASDGRYKYLEYTASSYPYTVVLESEIKTNTTSAIPKWFPIEGFHVSIEKNRYTILNPKSIHLRAKERNFDGFSITATKEDQKVSFEIKNQKAQSYERYAPSITKLFPSVLFGLDTYAIKGLKGTAINWKEFGKWEYDVLIKEKDNLSEEAKLQIQQLTEHLTDTLEKAKFIYNYVQENTRYISVQYGIGGLSPAYSNDVHKLGYGDCKGLTNYTKSLLEAVGIASYYTEIYAKSSKRNIEKDFHSIQGDHIILNLPYKGKDYWLECTSQTTPFGFLGTFTDDRDALILTPEGGFIKHTTVYKNETNLQETKANITLTQEGNIESKIDITTKGTQYNQHYYLENNNTKEVQTYYISEYWKNLNNLKLESYSFHNNKDSVTFNEKVSVSIKNYGSLAGDDLLIRVNVFNKYNKLPPRVRSRKLPIEVSRGFKDTDSYTFEIPESYQASYLPAKKEITNDFGSYEVYFEKIDATHFTYHRSLLIYDGIFPKESYNTYRDFLKSISKYDNLRIALTKI
ncbi:DUF3857 domain-containing protein [Flavicella sp.]|uniref:DUF3857 domain-containing protein n=1 Tax=Flavicella sp. TaxID=2957742 RepID=UPI002620EA5B|nr:DUF3857 domain-containing protein [Flavicella sp.]MDG1805140.1 DUF3857 domain-containing protein [Flavicella sp.]